MGGVMYLRKGKHHADPTPDLPEGYTRVKYIQSSGTQHIDTEFKPTAEDMRVICDVAYTTSPNGTCLYGAQTASTTFPITVGADGSNPTFFVGSSLKLLTQTMSVNTRYVLDAHAKNGTLTVGLNGVTKTASYSGSLDKTLNLALFGNNNNGTVATCASAKMYSCQIYDGEILARDYVPCINASGAVGLYDMVGRKFYGNAGTGAFLAGPPKVQLPSGYLQLEYIQSTGTQYLDTRFVPNQDTKVVCRAMYTQGSSATYLFGSDAGSGSAYFAFGSANGNLRFAYNTSSYYFESGLSFTDAITIEANRNVATINGSYTVTAEEAAFSSGYALYLFGDNRAGTLYGETPAKVYSCQIYDNGVLVRDYIPCVNILGEVGLFDLVGREFYGNAGTGVFLRGPVVDATLPDGYVRLEAIQSSGTQYVDTGFVPNQDTRVVAEFETQSNNGDWRCVFGARTTGNNMQSLGFYLSNADVFSGFYGDNEQFSFSGIPVAGRHIVDWNKNTITLDGTAQTLTAQTYNSTVSLYICSVHTPVEADTHYLQGKIYSCQIYDNGVLVRAFLPCLSPTQGVGLYDSVTQTFFGNAGDGSFLGVEAA